MPDPTDPPVDDPSPGDCRASVCVGGAVQNKPDDTDVPEASPCHPAACKDGKPQISPPGEVCGDGKKCSDNGVCRSLAVMGCADGTREGFKNTGTFPDIAACSGGWQSPGVLANMKPGCERKGGNHGPSPTGGNSSSQVLCNVQDLCAEGWHVCESKDDVSKHMPAGKDCLDLGVEPSTPVFFATAQPSAGFTKCDGSADKDFNDIFGCGPQDTAPGVVNCSPLNATLTGGCQTLLLASGPTPISGWKCDPNGANTADERKAAVKPAPGGGGVLCCKD